MLCGILLGRFVLPNDLATYLDSVTTLALTILIFAIGLELGRSRQLRVALKAVGSILLLLPVAVAIGSIIGAYAAGILLNLPGNESSAIGAGFGWYSLSGILLAQIYSAETGALAFLTNVIRELIAFMLIPVLAARTGRFTAIAPAGATSMDTTLPLISRVGGPEAGLVALISGATLSALVPVLVPILIGL